MWRTFWKLDRRRSGNGYSALPVSHCEVDAWCRLHGERFAPWELDLLDRMEVKRLSFLNGSEPTPALEPMTPNLFSSMFGKK